MQALIPSGDPAHSAGLLPPMPMDCPRTAHGLRAGVPFECLWRMIVRPWRLLFAANALQAHLALQFGCKFSSNCSASAQKGKIREIFVDVCCPWNPQNRALAYTRARFSSFCHVAFQNIPEASKMRPKDLPRAVWEALGRALGLSWALLGCSWGTLGLFLG